MKNLREIIRKERIVNRAFNVAVLSGTGTAFAGAIVYKPILMYGAIVGTAITIFAGAHYHDTREQRERRYVL